MALVSAAAAEPHSANQEQPREAPVPRAWAAAAAAFGELLCLATSARMLRDMNQDLHIDEDLQPRVKRRRKAVARSRTWHDQRRAEGRPEPRNAHAAIAKAAAFVLAVPTTTVPAIDVLALIETATLVLQNQGYARIPSRNLVISILKPQDEHRDPFVIPNTSGFVDERLVRQPAGRKRQWTRDDFAKLRTLVERLRAASPNEEVTGVPG